MATVAATGVTEVSNRDKAGIAHNIQAVIPTAGATDNVTVTLPARWQGQGFAVLSVSAEKWTTGSPATAAGARSKTALPISVVSFVELTGVVTLLLGGTAVGGTETGRVYMQVELA